MLADRDECFYSFSQMAWGSLVWEDAGRSRCSLLPFTLLLLGGWDSDAGIGSAHGRRRTQLAPWGVSQLARPASGLPSLPLSSWPKVWESLSGRSKLGPAAAAGALGGLRDWQERDEKRTANMKLCRTFLGKYYSLVLESVASLREKLCVLASVSLLKAAQRSFSGATDFSSLYTWKRYHSFRMFMITHKWTPF